MLIRLVDQTRPVKVWQPDRHEITRTFTSRRPPGAPAGLRVRTARTGRTRDRCRGKLTKAGSSGSKKPTCTRSAIPISNGGSFGGAAARKIVCLLCLFISPTSRRANQRASESRSSSSTRLPGPRRSGGTATRKIVCLLCLCVSPTSRRASCACAADADHIGDNVSHDRPGRRDGVFPFSIPCVAWRKLRAVLLHPNPPGLSRMASGKAGRIDPFATPF